MAETKKVPKNSTPSSNGLENSNGKRSATGLVIAGLVTVVGSWIGMAAYMDYRLQGMEERIASETKQQVVTEADGTRGALDAQFNRLTKNLDEKITDTSSVLAKGLLNLTEKADNHHNELIQSLTEGKTQLIQKMEEGNQQVSGLLTQQNDTLQKSLVQPVTSLQDQVTQVLTKVDSQSQTAQTMEQTARESGEAVLASVKNVENNLAEVKSGLVALDEKAQSMEELIKLSNNAASDKLTELAASMSSALSGSSEGNQKLSGELSELAQQVTALHDAVNTSQNEVHTLSATLPEWQKTSQQQLQTLTDSAQSVNQSVQTNLGGLIEKFNAMNQQIDKTSESMMRALYLTSESMEGTKTELKSELENSKKTSEQQVQDLVQSMRDLSQKLESFKSQEGGQTSSQSSYIPLHESPQFQTLASTLKTITSKTVDLRSQIDSQVNEVKARTDKMDPSTPPDQATAVQDMLHSFTSLADTAGSELDTLLENLQNLDQMMNGLQAEVKTPGGEATAAAPVPEQTTKENSEIGMKQE